MRVLAFLLAAHLSGSVRVVKRQAQAVTRNSTETYSVDVTVRVKVENIPDSKFDKIKDGFWTAVGNIDPDAPIGEELKKVGLSVLGTALGAVNPVLGFAWSIFTSLFIRNKSEDPLQGLLRTIYAHVDKMITGALDAFWMDRVGEKMEQIDRVMRRADANHDWDEVKILFQDEADKVFHSDCWAQFKDNPWVATKHPSAACDRWRLTGGGAKALVLELKFLELMVGTHTEIERLGRSSGLKDTLLIASRLALVHARRWVQYRSVFRGTEGHTELMYTCPSGQQSCGRKQPGYCRAILGKDAETNKEFDQIDDECNASVMENGHHHKNFPCERTPYGEDTHCPTGCDPAKTLVETCRNKGIAAIEKQTKDWEEEAEQVRFAVCNLFSVRAECDDLGSDWLRPKSLCSHLPVVLQSHDGAYLKDNGGKLQFSAWASSWETWKLVPTGADPDRFIRNKQEVFIQSHRGQNLEDRNGRVGLHNDRGSYQKWTLLAHQGGVLIRSHRGKHLESRSGKVGVHDDQGGFQKWNVKLKSGHSKACTFFKV